MTIRADARQNGFVLDRLTYSDGAVLDISGTAGTILPVPTLDDHDLWVLGGKGPHWPGAHALALSNNIVTNETTGATQIVNGYANSLCAYPMTGSWRCSYDFLFGKASGTPADCLTFGLVTTPRSGGQFTGTGLEFDLRYYINEDPWNCGRLTLKAANTNLVYIAKTSPTSLLSAGRGAHVDMSYDADARVLSVQVQGKTSTWSTNIYDFSMLDTLKGKRSAYFHFFGGVGGLWTENIVSNFVFTSDAMDAATRPATPAFAAFDAYSGSGTLVKRGLASLGILSTNAQDVAVRVEEGGLVLRKELTEPLPDADDGGWTFSHPTGGYGTEGGVRIGRCTANNADSAHLRRRVRIAGRWRLSYDVYMLGYTTAGGTTVYPADGIAVGFHNDSRGTAYLGSPYGSCGLVGNSLKNAFGFGWYVYNSSNLDKMGLMNADCKGFGFDTSFAAVPMRNNTLTHHVLEYDGEAKTFTVTMTNDAGGSVTQTYTDVDIPARVKDDYAWLAVGTGGGGVHAVVEFRRMKMEYLDETPDFLPERALLGRVDVTADDTPVTLETARTGTVFRLSENVSVADGATLRAVSSVEPATLTMGALSLGEGATLAGDGATPIRADALTLADDTLALDGAVVELSAKDALAKDATLRLKGGAKVKLDYAGTMQIDGIEVDGVALPRNLYSADAVDWIVPGSTGRLSTGQGTVLILR